MFVFYSPVYYCCSITHNENITSADFHPNNTDTQRTVMIDSENSPNLHFTIDVFLIRRRCVMLKLAHVRILFQRASAKVGTEDVCGEEHM